MASADLVVFDSHVIHASGENLTSQVRPALWFHFATTGTIDGNAERFGGSPLKIVASAPKAGSATLTPERRYVAPSRSS